VTQPATANRWGLWEAAGGFLVGLVLAAIATSISESATGYRSGPFPVAVTTADVVALWAGLVGAAVWASRRRGTGDLAVDYGLRIGGPLDIVGGAAVGVACQYLLIPGLYWPVEQLDHSLRHQLGQPAHNEAGTAHSVGAVVVLVVVLVIGAPFVEELFFRGLLLRGLLGVTRPPVAIVVSGLLFGLAHFEAAQFAGLAVFGVILGVLAWRTGRLVPGMAAHAAFNAVAVASVVHLH
jgi:uncharacterized protein